MTPEFRGVAEPPRLLPETPQSVQLREHYTQWSEQHPVLATTVETLGVVALRLGVRSMGKKLDINLGNAFTASEERRQQALEHPLFFAVATAGLMPVVEEIGARAAPVALGRKYLVNPERRRAIEHGAQACFAAWHAAYIRPEAHFNPFGVSVRLKRPEEPSSLPVSQFIAGEHLLRIYKKRGFWHAVGAHALNNSVALVSAIPTLIRHKRKA